MPSTPTHLGHSVSHASLDSASDLDTLAMNTNETAPALSQATTQAAEPRPTVAEMIGRIRQHMESELATLGSNVERALHQRESSVFQAREMLVSASARISELEQQLKTEQAERLIETEALASARATMREADLYAAQVSDQLNTTHRRILALEASKEQLLETIESMRQQDSSQHNREPEQLVTQLQLAQAVIDSKDEEIAALTKLGNDCAERAAMHEATLLQVRNELESALTLGDQLQALKAEHDSTLVSFARMQCELQELRTAAKGRPYLRTSQSNSNSAQPRDSDMATPRYPALEQVLERAKVFRTAS